MEEILFQKTFIIAESGVNHNGDIEMAKDLIHAAKECNADAVKFQSFKARRVISRFVPKLAYQRSSSSDSESQLAMLEKLELNISKMEDLADCARKLGIIFLSTPKDIPSLNELRRINLPAYKVGSSELDNLEFLEHLASFDRPIILSTGMATLGEVEEAIGILRSRTQSTIVLMHCVSQYPCSMEEVNLRAMVTLRNAFQLPVGYSDHTLGIEVPISAVTLGAKVIEKHFTLNKNLKGPDHQSSLEPIEFKQMVASIRNVEKCLGDGLKKPSLSEISHRKLLRRTLVFNQNLRKGALIKASTIAIKRAGGGLEPKYKGIILNRVLTKDVVEDEPVKWDVF